MCSCCVIKSGLGAYMKDNAYGNTETTDLWTAWENSSQMPIGEMMASWTEQMGFPLLKVMSESWEDDKVTFTLEQSWFLSDGSELSSEEAEKKWTIPIITCTEDGTQSDMIFMREKTVTIIVPILKGGWVKLNAGQEVPMRVQPTPAMLARLAEGIVNKKLPPCDRAALLSDTYALVKAGHMEPEALIRLLSSYKNEDAYIVWQSLSEVIRGLDTVMSDDNKMNTHFSKFARGIIVHLVEFVGWEPDVKDEHLTTLLRNIMLQLLSKFCYDDSAVAEEAKKRFGAFQEDHNDIKSLPSDMRTPVFKIFLQNGGEQEYEQVKAYFDAATDNAERKHVLGSLGSTRDPKLKHKTLEWTISGAIKMQDFFYAMGSVGGSSREGREISWQFYQDNFERIKNMIGTSGPSLMDACFVSCAGSFCSAAKADEIEAFFRANPLPQNARKIAQTVENMRANAKFLGVIQASDLAKDEFWGSL